MPEQTERKTIGARLDIDLVTELKIEALKQNLNFEDLLNKTLWEYIEKQKEIENKKISKEKIDKKIDIQ